MLGLKAKDASGEVVAAPTLELVLSYEFQIRKHMTKAMNEGTDMQKALQDAMKDTTVKERYFLTPATLEAASKPRGDVRLKSRSPRRYEDREQRESSGGYRGHWTHKSRGEKGKKGGGKGKKGGKTPQPYTRWKGHLLRVE